MSRWARRAPKPQRVAAAVGRVLADPAYRTAAQRIKSEMVGHDAGREGADLLEQLAATRHTVLRPTATVTAVLARMVTP